jgi:hypothetical protein
VGVVLSLGEMKKNCENEARCINTYYVCEWGQEKLFIFSTFLPITHTFHHQEATIVYIVVVVPDGPQAVHSIIEHHPAPGLDDTFLEPMRSM